MFEWFKENNLECTSQQAKKLLFRWILYKSDYNRLRNRIKYAILQIIRDDLISMSELIKKVYEYESQNADN